MTPFSNPPDFIPISLSGQDVLDWVHWARVGARSADRKSGANLISDLTIVGPDLAQRYTACFDDFSWNDGDVLPTTADACSGLFLFNLGDGFQISVPADTTPKTLKLYIGAEFGTAKLQASLSDSSVTSYVDRTMLTDGSAAGTYSIDFQAGSPGQTLTVTYTFDDSVGGDITLEAAALTAKHPDVAIAQPALEQIFNAPATFTASVLASQENASINTVSLLQDNNLLFTLSDSPFDFPGRELSCWELRLHCTDDGL